MQQAPDCTYLWLWYGSFTVLSNNKNKINIEAVWWVSDYSLTLAGFARGTYLPSLPFVCKRYLPTFFTFSLQEVPTYLLYLLSARGTYLPTLSLVCNCFCSICLSSQNKPKRSSLAISKWFSTFFWQKLLDLFGKGPILRFRVSPEVD